ncbi:hypothetical protein TSUD_132670 [Trifolium subterraneum]|uniref:Uncharacterized protein n=1 Tax=Trifolium subterraneum TaxID=3900 RepID=A0A2Z6M716_TRISU|nr:hypothetical protein TSUD_132670 [Trifolium subterraneum]
MINQEGLRRRVERNVQTRVCSFCDLDGRSHNKTHLTRRKIQVTMRKRQTQPKHLLYGCGEEIIDLRKYLTGLRWGIGRDFGEEIIDLRKYLPGPQWGIARDFGEEIIDLRKYLSGPQWSVHREIVEQDDAGEGAEKVVEEKAAEVDDGDVMNDEEISTPKSLNFDLNELPPAEERVD